MKEIKLLEHFLKNPGRFSILILGDRGTGKTKWVKQITQEKIKKKLVVANCASFSDDTMAESELFGHLQGSFTDAKSEKKGLFAEANNGYLFLDEIHNLSLRVQEKLMTSLQTESSGKNQGKFRIRQLGAVEDKFVTVTPVFASNLKLGDLRKKILPDLYDRISQLVIEIPSLFDRKVDIHEEFKIVWGLMDFKQNNFTPNQKQFIEWINRIALDGNYRTLEIIAINWHQARLIEYQENEESYVEEKELKVFEFVKGQISKFHSSNLAISPKNKFNFRKGLTKKQLEREYQEALYDWAISDDGYKNPTEAQKGLSVSRLKNPHKHTVNNLS